MSLDQGTSAWLAWRHDGIGASEADAILGRNPWKSAASLLREKVAPPRLASFTNAAMARGHALEPEARARFCDRSGIAMEPACLASSGTPFMRASVDGICLASRRLLEIKCGEKAYAITERSGEVPSYYVGQLQHILAVTGFEAIDYWCWLPGRKPLHLHIERDEAFIGELRSTEARFWDRVLDQRQYA